MINSDPGVMLWVHRQDLSKYLKPQKDKCLSLTDLSKYPLNNLNFLIHPSEKPPFDETDQSQRLADKHSVVSGYL